MASDAQSPPPRQPRGRLLAAGDPVLPGPIPQLPPLLTPAQTPLARPRPQSSAAPAAAGSSPFRLVSPARPLAKQEQELWQQALTLAAFALDDWILSAQSLPLLRRVFGQAGTAAELFEERATQLLAELAAGRFSLAVEWRSDVELAGANGAYISAADGVEERIVLNRDRLAAGRFDADGLSQVLLEELAHGFDRYLNGASDSPGDEGRSFAAALLDLPLGGDALERIAQADDSILLSIDGRELWAEAAASGVTVTPGTYGGSNSSFQYSVTLDANGSNGADLLVAIYADTSASTTLIGWQIVNRQTSFAANAVYTGSFNVTNSRVNRIDTEAIGIRVWEGTAGSSYGTGNNTTPVITYGNANLAAGSATGFRADTTSNPDKNSSVVFTGTPTANKVPGFVSSSSVVSIRTVLPTLTSPFPSVAATGALLNNSIVLTFSEPVRGGGGTIAIQAGTASTNTYAMTLSPGASSGSFSTGGGSWTIVGQQLLIKPTSPLNPNTTYNVDVSATALTDLDGNPYAGITSTVNSGLYFTTGTASDTTAPSVSLNPPLATLVEAGGVNNGLGGTPTTSLSINRTDAGGGTYFNPAVLSSNGWSSSDGGASFVRIGTYGSASLATATGLITYRLNNQAPSTEALTPGESVSDAFGSLELLDYANNASATDEISFEILGANDAPRLDPSASPALSTIQEDNAPPSAGSSLDSTLVSSLLVGVSDPDSTDLGIAIRSLNSSIGTLYYSLDDAASWQPVGSASDANLLLLASHNRLYFQGASKVAGSFSDVFGFYAWDRTAGQPGDRVSLVAPTLQSLAQSLSGESDTVGVTVTIIPDAPVLDPAPLLSVVLPGDAPAPVGAVGFLVDDLLVGASDPDPGTTLGLAVIAADQSNGSWHFSSDGGSSWTAFSSIGSLSASTALLIPGGPLGRLYFQPNPGYNGTEAQLSFRAWDQSGGVAGGLADTTSNGGATPFSIATDSLETRLSGGGVLLQGSVSGDRLIGGWQADLLQGGAGPDTMSGGEGRDAFFNPSTDSTVVIGGSGDAGTISGFDVITDLRLADGSSDGDGFAQSEYLRVTPAGTTASLVSNTSGLSGTASTLTIAGATVKSRSVSSGIARFDDATSFAAAGALVLSSESDVAAVVEYLAANDLGNAGVTLAFVTDSYSAGGYVGPRTFVYTQTSTNAGSSGGFGLLELRGVTASSLTTNAGTTTAGALLISNALPPTASLLARYPGTEEDTLTLQVSGNPLPIFADSDSTGNLTVTLAPASGSINAAAAAGITVGGSAGARTLSGSAAALDAYVRTTAITYTPEANAFGDIALAITVSDGSASNTYMSLLSLAGLPDPPQIDDAVVTLPKAAAINSVVLDVNDALSGGDSDVDGEPLTYTLSSDSSNGGFRIDPQTGVISLFDPVKINITAGPTTVLLGVSASDGTSTDEATITINLLPTILMGTPADETLTGSALDNLIQGLAGNDNLSGLDGRDLLVGGPGADTMTGGFGSDSFWIPTGDNTVLIGGSGNNGTLSGVDVITDYSPAGGGAPAEHLRVTPVGTAASIVAQGDTNGVDSVLTLGGATIKSHRVSASGIASFDDADTFKGAVKIDSTADVAAVVDYLRRNDIGDAGSVVGFATASFNASGFSGVRTYVYTQETTDTGISGGYSLIELRGFSAAGLSSNPASTTTNTVLISNNLPPLVNMPGGFRGLEDVSVPLPFADTPFIDPDTTGATASGPLTVTLSVAAGTIAASSADAVTVTGGATSRSFNGTIADLNSYFTTPGRISFTGATDANGMIPLTLLVSDGQATNNRTYTTTIVLEAVNDPPTLTAAAASNTLIEAGGVANGTAGVSKATVQLTKADVDSTVVFDHDHLLANGWSSSDAGLSYSRSGTYGTVLLNSLSGLLTYQLDDSRAATDSLRPTDTVQDAFTIQVSDGALTASTIASFQIVGRNDAPSVTAPANLSLPENSSGVIFSASASDPEASPVSLSLGGADAAFFSIDASGAVRFNAAPDYETPIDSGSNNVYNITVQASDGSLVGSQAVAITVTDVNEAPTAVSLAGAISTLADDTPTDNRVKLATIVISDDALGSNNISLSGAHADAFEVVAKALYLKAGTVLDNSIQESYSVTITVADPSLDGSTPVSVPFVLSVVDGTAPQVQSVAISEALGAQNGVLNAADVLLVEVTMSEPVLVSGDPTLTLQIGADSVLATYASGLSTDSVLVFTTTIQPGQAAAAGVAIPANGLVNSVGGSIVDLSDNPADLSFTAVAANPAYKVDTAAPSPPLLALAAGLSTPLTREQLTRAAGAVTVTAELGSVLELDFASDGVFSASTTVFGFSRTLIASGGPQTIVVTTAEADTLNEGAITVTARTTDPAGNVSDDAIPLHFEYVAPQDPIGELTLQLLQSGHEDGPLPTRFEVRRSGPLDAAATIRYVLSGNAVAGVDYQYATGSGYASNGFGSLSFAVGVDTAIIELPTIDNSVVNTARTLSLTLQASALYTVATGTVTASLSDNDSGAAVPVVAIGAASLSEQDSGTTEGSITVSLDRSTTNTVTVAYSFRAGTATAANDYVASNGTLIFAPGVTSLAIPFTIIGDITVEPDETFFVDITLPNANAVFAGAALALTGTVTIVNDDPNLGINLTSSGTFSGGPRNDVLIGSPIADSISGLAGDDKLQGMGGPDILNGGTGADWFIYNDFADSTLLAPDVLGDFSPAEGDRIALASLPTSFWGAGTLSAGSLEEALALAMADPDLNPATPDPLAAGEAVLFRWGNRAGRERTYLAVEGGSTDLFLDLGGYNPGTTGLLPVSSVFASSLI